MAASIPKRLANHCESRGLKTLLQIRAQLFAPYGWSIGADIVLAINLPPRIEHRAGRRSL
jgi:hypothetical protein